MRQAGYLPQHSPLAYTLLYEVFVLKSVCDESVCKCFVRQWQRKCAKQCKRIISSHPQRDGFNACHFPCHLSGWCAFLGTSLSLKYTQSHTQTGTSSGDDNITAVNNALLLCVHVWVRGRSTRSIHLNKT